jgi:hypothetical protein
MLSMLVETTLLESDHSTAKVTGQLVIAAVRPIERPSKL